MRKILIFVGAGAKQSGKLKDLIETESPRTACVSILVVIATDGREWTACVTSKILLAETEKGRHCEERSDEAIQEPEGLT